MAKTGSNHHKLSKTLRISMLFTYFQPFSAGSTGSTGSVNYAPELATQVRNVNFTVQIKVKSLMYSRDESSTTHNSTHFLTCVVYMLCICKPKTDMCGHVCHMSTQLFKKCVSKLCIFTEFNQK